VPSLDWRERLPVEMIARVCECVCVSVCPCLCLCLCGCGCGCSLFGMKTASVSLKLPFLPLLLFLKASIASVSLKSLYNFGASLVP
jgi:hypothetical protein